MIGTFERLTDAATSAEIESRYHLIYDRFDEGGLDWVVDRVNDGWSLPAFADLPGDLQEAISANLSAGKAMSFETLVDLSDELVLCD